MARTFLFTMLALAWLAAPSCLGGGGKGSSSRGDGLGVGMPCANTAACPSGLVCTANVCDFATDAGSTNAGTRDGGDDDDDDDDDDDHADGGDDDDQ